MVHAPYGGEAGGPRALTLNSEHDRLLEVAQTYECNLLDTIRTERANLVDSFQKQRAILEKSLSEQQHIVQESLENQDRLVATARQDRQRGKNTIENLRSEFSQLRAAAAERERGLARAGARRVAEDGAQAQAAAADGPGRLAPPDGRREERLPLNRV
ncbi:hypothetical protein THAOC_27552, partial [Thalassiosira oceanica]